MLLTRPAAQSARFADAVQDRFGPEIRVVISPLMGPVFLPVSLPQGRFDALILTSETGATAARRILAEGGVLPQRAYCVGDQTARVAEAAGFVVRSAAGDANALLALIGSAKPAAPLLYLRGRDARGAITDRLNSKGFRIVERIVYAQEPWPPSAQARAILAGAAPVILPLLSPRSAALVLALPDVTAPLWVAALSPAVAAAMPEAARLAVAVRPDAAALMDAVAALLVAGSDA